MQATREFGPTVAGQQSYTFGGDAIIVEGAAEIEKVLHIAVAGIPYGEADETSIRWTNEGLYRYLAPSDSGAYYLNFTYSGVEQITVFPTPAVDGLSISAACVMAPPDLSDDQEPINPKRFDRFIFAWAAWHAYEQEEDNSDLGNYYAQQFEDGVGQLRLLRYSRSGREPFQAGLLGVTR